MPRALLYHLPEYKEFRARIAMVNVTKTSPPIIKKYWRTVLQETKYIQFFTTISSFPKKKVVEKKQKEPILILAV